MASEQLGYSVEVTFVCFCLVLKLKARDHIKLKKFKTVTFRDPIDSWWIKSSLMLIVQFQLERHQIMKLKWVENQLL